MSLPPLPNVIGERYRPIRLLGRGGGGAVYEVEHLHTGARAALKLLTGFEGASADAVARFRREARMAAAIDSEHVVRITDAGTADELAGTPFLVMELMQGRTLEQEAQKPIEPARVVELLSQVARALERAHAAGIIHRDLKPDNMFLTQREDGSALVKLLDFGIAKHTGAMQHGSGGLGTQQGTVLGTPIYMAPEQAQGQAGSVDARTDTWALGMIAFRLLFGVPYFAPDHTLRLLHRVVFEPVSPPSELGFVATPAFDAWFLKSCSHDRAVRFGSPAEQIRQLGEALRGLEQVEIRKNILEARAQKYSASTVQQAPTELQGGYSTPNTPWADGPMLQTPSSDSGRRAAPVSLAGSTPPNLPSIAPPAPRSTSRVVIPLVFVGLVLLSAAAWLWKVTRSVPLTDETTGPVEEPSPAAAKSPASMPQRSEPALPAAVPAEDAVRIPTLAPDAAMPQPKSVANPRPETQPVRKPTRPATRKPNYDPLGDRH